MGKGFSPKLAIGVKDQKHRPQLKGQWPFRFYFIYATFLSAKSPKASFFKISIFGSSGYFRSIS